jgi:N-acetylneuraminate synthase
MDTEMGTYIIAEAGVNHDGSAETAMRLVDAAAASGADSVKFQTFRAERLLTGQAPKAAYQLRTTDAVESQFEMIRRLELPESAYSELVVHARSAGLRFLSTPFDVDSLRLLVDRFGLEEIKVSSGDITNAPFLLEIARVARRVIISTGMSTLCEIEAALGVLAYGMLVDRFGRPGRGAFEEVYASDEGQAALRERVSVLHCTTEYPAPYHEVNLRAMDTIAAAFGLTTGYSDHTQGIHVPIAAVARGASIIEKHFTLDRSRPGPDHKASLEPGELATMVRCIREIEASLGDGVKRPTRSEWANRAVARKSLVAATALSRGDPMAMDCKRSGSGVSPFEFWRLDGQPAERSYRVDEPIDD